MIVGNYIKCKNGKIHIMVCDCDRDDYPVEIEKEF